METFKRTPLQLFNLPQHFVIPLFQRPYVWREEEQWEPLWDDVRRVAELRIAEPHQMPQHFLGAIVLQAHDASSHRLTTWNVIDGQQRLTTLQLLADATAAVLAERGFDRLVSQLEGLTHNAEHFVGDDESRLKLRHLNQDRAAFDEVMTAEPPVDHAAVVNADSQIVQAHAYFSAVVERWLGVGEAFEYENKAQQLTSVLLDDLQLVTIELRSNENSQEIFETLNARGTPLTAADLVRNFIFQRLESEGADTKKAYKEQWPFESKFWMKEVSVGRYFVSRSSLFLNQWLTSRTGELISPQSTFTRFKSYVEHPPHVPMASLLAEIKQQADQYQAWTEAAAKPSGELSVAEMAVYRMQMSGIEVLKPLLIWLHEPGKGVPAAEVDRAVRAAESWVVRRQLLRLANGDLGRVVADVIQAHMGAPVAEVGDRVIAHLARLNVTSTYWPGNDEVRSSLATEAAYKRFPRARLRSYLEAIENQIRAETGQPQVERTGMPIEHLLPQKWRDHWPVSSIEDEIHRDSHVHRLGNLTLLTGSLNSKVSNGTWATKRRALLKHNTVKLTGRLVDDGPEEWNENAIDTRTDALIEMLLQVWPVPEGHEGVVSDPQSKAQEWVEVKHLLAAGLISPGAVLEASHRDFQGVTATVGPDGLIEIDGRRYESPSGASKHLIRRASNGWYFWRLPDGRRLRDVRAEYLALPNERGGRS